ncbi:MAG TPA: hypothetical protein VD948_08595 [Rhodothermales bacterium]|nr:hypothetical protein [Rhodothermales bacterium]
MTAYPTTDSRAPGATQNDRAPIATPAGIRAPGSGYVQELKLQHERLIGTRARSTRETSGSNRTAQSGGGGEKTLDTITRTIRLYRKMVVEPRIPANYKKTTQVVRAGQAIFADLCLRLPAVLTAKPMVVKADPLDDEDESQEAATKKEEWTAAVLLGTEGRRAILDNGKTSVWRDYMDNLVNVGRGAYLLQVREDRWSKSVPGFPTTDDYEDDGDDVPKSKRKTRGQKYRAAVDRFKRDHCPFVLENLDPLSLYVVEDEDGVDDEAIYVVKRPYRATLSRYGLKPSSEPYNLPDAREGFSGVYVPGPSGFGRPYPIYEFETVLTEPDSVETVTYYCSAKRARALGLITDEDGADPDAGVWAVYVDGVAVDGGYLPGPAWHPLPVFRAYGLSTAMADPTYQGIPAPMHLIELIALLDQIITIELHISMFSGFPIMVEEDKSAGGTGATGLPDDTLNDPERVQRPGNQGSKESTTIEPGMYKKMPAGRTVRWMPLPAEATVHLERLYAHARELVDLVGIPSVFRGQGGGGQAGYAIAQLNIAARSLYDPVVANATATAATSVSYLWWQVWRRFSDGVPVYYGGDKAKGKQKGWKTLLPSDIAPDAKGAGKGTPFLACTVKADPLLPTDEAAQEQRGILALQAGVADMLTVREKYFADEAPERTEARRFADRIMENKVTQATETYRALVRAGRLLPKMAIYTMAAELGVDPQLAYEQLVARDAFTSEQLVALQQEQAQVQAQIAAMQPQGGMGLVGPDGMPIPPTGAPAGAGGFQPTQLPSAAQLFGLPSIPGVPQTPQIPLAPTPPSGPPIQTGNTAGLRAGQATTQPTPDTRTARNLAA